MHCKTQGSGESRNLSNIGHFGALLLTAHSGVFTRNILIDGMSEITEFRYSKTRKEI